MAYLDKCVAVLFYNTENLESILDFMLGFIPVERVAATKFRKGMIIDMVWEIRDFCASIQNHNDYEFFSYHKYGLFYVPIFYDIFTQLIEAAPPELKPEFIKIRKSIR